MTKKLSEGHKANIAKSVKMRWERGDFDSEEIRDVWRQVALSGIAKKGRVSPNKFVPSQEMIDDYSKMGDSDLSEKYGVSRSLIIKTRKRYNLPRFNNQHGTYPHEFRNGKEYKWCQQGHWEFIENFGKHISRYDGLRGWCKSCEHKKAQEYYDNNDGARRARDYVKTEKGKKSKSATMRKVWLKRRGNYIKFDLQDEERIYDLCNHSCAYCKTPIIFDDVEFDHFIPVKSGGMTEPKNMLPSCSTCNRGRGGKLDKDPYQWLMQKFGAYYGEQIYINCVSILERLA